MHLNQITFKKAIEKKNERWEKNWTKTLDKYLADLVQQQVRLGVESENVSKGMRCFKRADKNEMK